MTNAGPVRAFPRIGHRPQAPVRTAGSRWAGHASVVVVTLVACYGAAARPSVAYMLLLTAVAANMWFLGRVRALPITLGTIGLVALVAPPSAAPQLRLMVKDPPHMVLFVAIVVLIGAATNTLLRARQGAEQHAAALRRLNQELEGEMEEVRTLSEQLHESNQALTDALAAAERTAERADNLQEFTAVLARATTVAEVADVVLTRGLRAVQASRGYLLLADDADAHRLLAAAGYAPGREVAFVNTQGDAALLRESLRQQWSFRIDARTAEGAAPARAEASVRVHAREPLTHTTLPLTRGDDVVGRLAFECPACEALGATDRPFTGLLAQVTADAIWRARTFDAEREARRVAELTARAREEVLGIVAHDLRNPLHLVGSSAQLLMEPTLPPERRDAIYAISVRAVTRMNRLIGDLLDVARMETGRLQLDVRACDLNRLLREGLEPFHARAAEAGVALEVVGGAAITVHADELRLLQLLDNLVGNALKFTPPGGRIVVSDAVVSDATHGAQVRVAVSDTGPGISEEHRARLFDPFWQARGGDRRGIGLGLTIAKAIAEAHGGRLWVESTPGAGSTFQFALPASRARL